ncbi:MAG: sigma 54-interacting transcriptional regulator, partial [Deltaproteobacteria bacterium]|nr:sigma 54-interacting transcriptional regulator [Deltaproteobacteria bacterium]
MAELLSSVNDLKKEVEKGRRAKEALHESEERFRSMMEAVNDPVFICSSDLIITYINPAMMKRIRSDAVGQPCYRVIHGQSTVCSWCAYDKIKKGESCITETTSSLDNRCYSVSHYPIFHGDGSVSMMTVFRDLTRQKQTENALRESETRYRNLAEQVMDGVVVVQDGVFAFVNPAFAAKFGHKNPDDLLGMKMEEMTLTGFDRFISDAIECSRLGHHQKEIKETYTLGKGETDYWIEARHKSIKWKGKPAVLSTIRDVTTERRQELAMQKEAKILREENARLKSSMKERFRLGKMIGKSPAIQKVYDLILMASGSNENVIIYGESGTGKELVSREIHEMSHRRDEAFVTVNCGAIPETLLESEFFGYKKGAFTGALRDKYGYLDLADGGTLFLDEVGELNMNMQVK